MGNGIYFKIAGWVDLDMPHIEIWWKKGNNSKMGNQIYFKIAG